MAGLAHSLHGVRLDQADRCWGVEFAASTPRSYLVCPPGRLPSRSVLAGVRDGCVVEAEPFAALVRSHVSRWRIEHPSEDRERNERGFYNGSPDDAPVQALAWLAAVASHIADPDGRNRTKKGRLVLVVPKGLLENLLAGKHPRIELRVAEAIAIALDAPYETAGIEVFPNPKASQAERDACCAAQPAHDDEAWGSQPLVAA